MKKIVSIIFIFFGFLFLPGNTLAKELNKPIKILIVPGHDDESYGTSYKGIKEADMNVKLGLMIFDELSKDKNYEVHITRDWNGYTKDFKDLFENQKNEISDFMLFSKEIYNEGQKQGDIKNIDNVNHNEAAPDMVYKLYGINYWANKNNIDAVIHVHFNDYPRSNISESGKYKGFAIYVPYDGYKNYKESSVLSFFLLHSLLKKYQTSTYIKELSGIVPEQDLIAIGTRNTLNSRSVLVEYGYIYENILSTFYKRDKEFKKMALLTTEGIKRYFDYIKK